MCILIVKPAGVKVPSDAILDNCMLRNNHGFGFAVAGEKVFKTLNYNEFMKALKTVSKDKPCIIHFRYATHGTVKKANAHPFKINDISFAHNGILDVTPIGDKTDSETAFRYILKPAIETFGIESVNFDNTVKTILGSSKFAFLTDKGTIRMFGNFIEDNGIYYSNSGYKAQTFARKYNPYAYNYDYSKNIYKPKKYNHYDDDSYEYNKKQKVYNDLFGSNYENDL